MSSVRCDGAIQRMKLTMPLSGGAGGRLPGESLQGFYDGGRKPGLRPPPAQAGGGELA